MLRASYANQVAVLPLLTSLLFRFSRGGTGNDEGEEGNNVPFPASGKEGGWARGVIGLFLGSLEQEKDAAQGARPGHGLAPRSKARLRAGKLGELFSPEADALSSRG